MCFAKSWLTKDEENTVKQALIDFVLRVSSVYGDRHEEEIKILPRITEILLNNATVL